MTKFATDLSQGEWPGKTVEQILPPGNQQLLSSTALIVQLLSKKATKGEEDREDLVIR